MINLIIDTFLTTAFTLILSIGICVTMLWAFRNIKEVCCSSKWICEYCGDIVKSTTQPYCKPCSHIERSTKKMFKIKNKKCCGKKCD